MALSAHVADVAEEAHGPVLLAIVGVQDAMRAARKAQLHTESDGDLWEVLDAATHAYGLLEDALDHFEWAEGKLRRLIYDGV